MVRITHSNHFELLVRYSNTIVAKRLILPYIENEYVDMYPVGHPSLQLGMQLVVINRIRLIH